MYFPQNMLLENIRSLGFGTGNREEAAFHTQQQI